MPWALSKVEALRDAQNKAQVLFDEVLAKKIIHPARVRRILARS
jgi:hypothetical protein